MHSVERIYLRQRCFDASNPRVAASMGPQYQYVHGISRRNKIPRCRVAVHTLWEKGIRFRHPDYDPDRAQKLISSSMSRNLSTRNISSKSVHAFLSNLAHRQTNAARGGKHTSSVGGGKQQTQEYFNVGFNLKVMNIYKSHHYSIITLAAPRRDSKPRRLAHAVVIWTLRVFLQIN